MKLGNGCALWARQGLELFFKAFPHRPLLAPGGKIAGRGWLVFAAVQQDLLVLKLKGRLSCMLVGCLEGRKGLSPLVARQGWQGLLALSESHFMSPDLSGLLQTSPCPLAGSLPAHRNPTWGAHGSRNHSRGFSPLGPITGAQGRCYGSSTSALTSLGFLCAMRQ